MNIAFIVTSYWSYGELLIAVMFAKRIIKSGYHPYFFIPSNHAEILKKEKIPYTLLFHGMGKINRILFQDYVLKYKPGLVILSDFLNYNFCEEHYGLTYEDLKLFDCPIGTFDNFDWTCQKRDMDTYGFRAAKVSNVNIDKYGFKIIPCPIANPLNKACGDKYYYSLMQNVIPYMEKSKKQVQEELGIEKDRPVVLITSAMWQETYKMYPHVKSFVEATDGVFNRLLIFLSKYAQVIQVGGKKNVSLSNIRYISRLAPSMFDRYAMACDLFLTRNITSTTLAKLTLSGVPTMVLSNSLRFKKGEVIEPGFPLNPQIMKALRSMDMCYPYRMFPVGWYRFLEPMLQDNPYIDVMENAEIFDEDDVRFKIIEILKNQTVRDGFAERAKKYRDIVASLDSPAEILRHIQKKL